MSRSDEHGIVAFLSLAEQLKQVRRQGWIDRGVPAPESTADHSWAMALSAWLLACDRDDVDPERVLLIALVHDLPEALAGDATPFDRHRDADGNIAADLFREAPVYDRDASRDKHARERAALDEMTTNLPGRLRARIIDAWEEYNSGQTAESQFVRQVDKLETLLQAELYKARHPEILIDSFRAGTDRDVTDVALRSILSVMHSSRVHDDTSEAGDHEKQDACREGH